MNIHIKTINLTNIKQLSFPLIIIFPLLMVIACGGDAGDSSSEKMKPVFDRKKVDTGFVTYLANCQKCHGTNGVGAKDWRTPGADGKYPPPPLNGSGHSWHHPKVMLKKLIREGTEPEGNMPGWKDKLSDEEIENVITWFQSIWPPQVYHAWSDIDKRKQ